MVAKVAETAAVKTKAHTMTLKQAQAQWHDAIEMKATIKRREEPLGEDAMLRLVTGGTLKAKVLYYNAGKITERIIVSRLALERLTWGSISETLEDQILW